MKLLNLTIAASFMFIIAHAQFAGAQSLDLSTFHDNNSMSHGQYLGGGIASLLLPFGIGHAIQGRYAETGWIFTVGELGSYGVMLGGALLFVENEHKASRTAISMRDTYTDQSGPMLLMIGGGLALTGFRIWEIIDAWSTPISKGRVKTAERKSSMERLAFVPIIAPNSLGLSMRF